MTRRSITFHKVVSQSDWTELRAFAASFGHTVDDTSRTPCWMIREGRKLFGYFSMAQFPVTFPNFHPEYTTPRNFVTATDMIKAWQHITTSGADRYPKGNFLTCFDSNGEVNKAAERLGYKKVGVLWECVGSE